MHSAETKTGAKRGTVRLVVLSALLLIAGRSAWGQTETVLYTFTGGGDGAHPLSPLTSDGAGNFYGTTPYAGLVGGYDGAGTVFELSPDGKGSWNETTIYHFTGGADGGNPYAGSMVFDTSGNRQRGTNFWMRFAVSTSPV